MGPLRKNLRHAQLLFDPLDRGSRPKVALSQEMMKWRDLDDELLAKVFNLVDFTTR